MSELELRVNGRVVMVEVSEDMPLLWVIRDILGLTGTKYSCGIGVCKACTVHLDGVAAPSCVIPVSEVAGRAITTIEGLGEGQSERPAGNQPHPVQQAWREIGVSQCGYCQPGQLMTAAALLAKHPAPTDAQIDEAMGDVLCRCGTYPRIRQAIHLASTIKPR